MTKFKEYPIYKKRDGQTFEKVSYIFADSFKAAKKQFAENMTKDNWNLSNDIVWLDESDGVNVVGWYDLNASIFGYFEEGTEKEGEPDYANGQMELLCSEKAIKKGFDTWSEDVYTWEIRKK